MNTGTYQNPQAVGYLGWVEPADRSWIVFVALDGTPVRFDRDPSTGAVK
jgi:hypothetical protein